jgi:transposase-like protein
MRNILAKVPHKEKARFAEQLKQIWLQPDKRSAKRMATLLAEEYEKRFPDAIHCLEEGLEDSLQFYHFPEIDKKRISSTNVVERIGPRDPAAKPGDWRFSYCRFLCPAGHLLPR